MEACIYGISRGCRYFMHFILFYYYYLFRAKGNLFQCFGWEPGLCMGSGALLNSGCAAQNGGIFFIVIKGIMAAAGGCVLLLFIYVEAKIFFAASGKAFTMGRRQSLFLAPRSGAYPSKSLYRRVSAGAAYLHRNPGARVIVSGGRGRAKIYLRRAPWKCF